MLQNRADISYDLNLEPLNTSQMPLITEATYWSSGIAAENIDVGYTYIHTSCSILRMELKLAHTDKHITEYSTLVVSNNESQQGIQLEN